MEEGIGLKKFPLKMENVFKQIIVFYMILYKKLLGLFKIFNINLEFLEIDPIELNSNIIYT